MDTDRLYIASMYPPLTKEEFAHFLRYEREFSKMHDIPMPLITSSLTRRVRRGLLDLFLCKWEGYFGFEINREEALSHYDKACVYDPEIKNLKYTLRDVELYRQSRRVVLTPDNL